MVERNLHESYAVIDRHLYCAMHRMSLKSTLYTRMCKDPCFSYLGQQSLKEQGLHANRKNFLQCLQADRRETSKFQAGLKVMLPVLQQPLMT